MNKREKEVLQAQLNAEKEVLKELEKQYKRALADIEERVKLFDYDLNRLDTAMSEEGLDDATKSLLQSQRRSRVYQKQYQEALRGQINGILDKLHGDEYATIQQYLDDSYTNAFVGTMYDIAGQGVPLILPIDQAAAVRAVQLESKVSKGYYEALGVDINDLKKTIKGEVSRGIATGMNYSDIARNINNAAKTGRSNAKRIARTEGHRIQQASTMDAQNAAKAKGADVVKQWDATMDGKTRTTHRQLDGQIREIDEDFEIGGMKAKAPGHFGIAGEDINCRCVSLTRARWALDEDELATLKKRAEYFGLTKEKAPTFEAFQKQYLKVANSDAFKMAAESQSNDWSKAAARTVTDEQKRQIRQYAEDKGIEIGDIDAFDGDVKLLMVEIDAIDRTCREYGVKHKVTVSARILEDDEDFAITDGYEIVFNSKAMRDRLVTEYNIINGAQFSARTLEDIALHEMGHIISEENSMNGLAIAKKAYYNVTGKYASTSLLKERLTKEVSHYAGDVNTEIIAEVIVGNKNNPTKFTEEFISLLKGALQ